MSTKNLKIDVTIILSNCYYGHLYGYFTLFITVKYGLILRERFLKEPLTGI